MEQKLQCKKESPTQSPKLGVRHTTCNARQLWSIQSQKRGNTQLCLMIEKRLHHDCIKRIREACSFHSAITVNKSCQDQASWMQNETRKQYTVQATADRGLPGQRMAQCISTSACHQMNQGSNLSGGSLGRKLIMGTRKKGKTYSYYISCFHLTLSLEGKRVPEASFFLGKTPLLSLLLKFQWTTLRHDFTRRFHSSLPLLTPAR